MITFFNAGAGSGKTYVLSEQLYLYLTEQNGNPDEVILTTFTVKAAEELKERVRQRLLEKGESHKASQMANALIGTINGVCSNLLEKYSLEQGLSSDLRVLDETSVSKLFETFLTGHIKNETYHELNHLCYRFSLLEKNDYRQTENLKPSWPALVKRLVEKFRSYDFKEDQMKASKTASIQKITHFLDTKENFKIDIEILLGPFERETDWPHNRKHKKKDEEPFSALQALKRKTNKKDFQWAELEKAGGELSVECTKNNPDIVKLIEAFSRFYLTKEFKNEWIRLTELLYDTAFDLINQYQVYKKERGLIDFTDQEALFLQMLQTNATVTREIAATYKLIMVDEFQDCSPLEIAIFTKLEKLITYTIWVGDPKQSVYGFRDSDQQLFTNTMNAVEKAGSEIKIRGTSFRSRPDLVEVVNQIFSGVFKDIIPKDRIRLRPSEECLSREKDYPDPALQVVFCEAKNLPSYYEVLAEKVKKIISSSMKVYDNKIKHFRKIRGNDIALLFRDGSNLEMMAEALKSIDLPISIESEGFQQQGEVLWISSLLRLLINPFDSLAIANLMLLEGAANNVEDLIKKRLAYFNSGKENTEESGNWNDYSVTAKRIEEHNLLISQMPLVQAVELLVSISDLPLYAARWGNYAARISNINQMIALAAEYQDQCRVFGMASTFSGFLDVLQSHTATPAIENEDAVQLLTVHKAKGLEWPMVVPVKLGTTMNAVKNIFNTIHVLQPEKFDLNEVLKGQKIIYLVWPFGSKEKVPSGLEQSADNLNIELKAYENTLKEEDRLLYVALTRAKEYILMPANTKPVSYTAIESINRYQASPLFTQEHLRFLLNEAGKSKTTRLQGSNLTIGVEILPAVESNESHDAVQKPKNISYYDHGIAVSPAVYTKRYISPSSFGAKDFSSVKVKDMGLEIPGLQIYKDSGATDDQIGNAIHHAFASWEPNNMKSKRIEIMRLLLSRLEFNGQIVPKLLDDNFEGFWTFIKKTYSPINVWKEYPLSSVTDSNGEVVNGIADLILEKEDTLIIVDHKTFRGSFEKQVMNSKNDYYAGKYQGQLNGYKLLLEKASGKRVSVGLINYVVQGRVVEVG